MPVHRLFFAALLIGAASLAFLAPASGEAPASPVAFSPQAEALPFPPDAREVEFDATFDEIEYRSSSSMPALVAFYRKELAARGWALEEESVVVEDDSVEMTFFHDGYQVDVDLDKRSDDVAASIECEGLDFSNSSDPAKLLAAGVPQPRAYLFLQKELPRPEIVDGESYQSDACHFKSPLPLQAAFDFFVQALRKSNWRETRRPIVTGDRRYTEFKKGRVEVGVNVFSDAVGSRIILSYENEAKEAVVPPLPPVAGQLTGGMVSTEEAAQQTTPKVAIDVAANQGTASIEIGGKTSTFKHVAAYRTKDDDESKTRLLFCEQAIPLQRMQTLLTKNGDFEFDELYPTGYPGHLTLEVSDRVHFSFNDGGVAMSNSIEEPAGEFKATDRRASGVIKMSKPEEFFDETYQISTSVDAAIMTPDTTLGSVPAPAPIAVRQSPFAGSELLLPEGCGNVTSEGTQYTKSTHAEVSLDPAAIAAFYRRELLAQGWKEETNGAAATDASAPLSLRFKQPAATMSVNIAGNQDLSTVDVLLLDDAKAKADGMLPGRGKGRIVLVNGHTQEVVIMIGKQRYPLKAGQGTTNPKSALNYTVAPGKYDLQIIPTGQAAKAESLEIAAGTTWGVIVLPGGDYLFNRLYGASAEAKK
jgi:hypothetical protein